MGVRAHIFAPDAQDSPAAEIAHSVTHADYTDEAALRAFASSIDCVTSEFENVPAGCDERAFRLFSSLTRWEKALHIAQNRLREKIWQNHWVSRPLAIPPSVLQMN